MQRRGALIVCLLLGPFPAAAQQPAKPLDVFAPAGGGAANNQAFVPQFTPSPPEADLAPILAFAATAPLTTRYLSLHNLPTAERRAAQLATSRETVNALSWQSAFAPLVPVPMPARQDGTQPEPHIYAFDPALLCRTEAELLNWLRTWEQLTLLDPYYVEPWVSADEAKQLYEMTGSLGAVLRADFFCYWARHDDDPNTKEVFEGFYSRFLGLPDDETAFFRLLRIDPGTVAILGSDRKAAVEISGQGSDAQPVAQNNRFLNRLPLLLTPHGSYLWYTQDFLNSSVRNRDIYDDPLNEGKDGGEYIFSLPNKLQGYYLTQAVKDKNGKFVKFARVAEVPIAVAVASNFAHARVKLTTCTACHVNGINTFTDSIGGLLVQAQPGKGVVKFFSHDPFKQIRAEQLFHQDLPSYALADQANYTAAILACTGMEAKAYAVAYKSCIDAYEAPVTPEMARWEFGTELPLEGENGYLADKVVSTTKGALLVLTKGQPIRRDKFEAQYHNGRLLQDIRQNIIAKNAGREVQLVVPSVVVGTAHSLAIPVDTTWVAYIGGKIAGPYTDDELALMLANGTVTEQTMVAPKQADVAVKAGDWKPAGSVWKKEFQKQETSIQQAP